MSSLGDVICNLPVVADIQQNVSDCKIDWVVEEAIVDIPKMHTGLNRIIPVALRRWRKQFLYRTIREEITSFRRELKGRQYDAIVDTQGLIKSALISRMAHGRVHGQDRKSAREGLAGWFYNNSYMIPRDLHAVQRNRLLVARALGYDTGDSEPDYGIDYSVTDGNTKGINWLPENYIFMIPGTARPTKMWSKENWIELSKFIESKGLDIVFAWGSENERLQVLEMSNQLSRAIVSPSRLNINQSTSVINRANVVIGVDTGFLHLSAALKRPTLGIYTDSDPALSGALAGENGKAINIGNVESIPDVAQAIGAINTFGI